MNKLKKYILIAVLLINYNQISFADDSARYWVNTEYLYWWVQNSPIKIPLITKNTNPSAFGIINEPGTSIIFGAGSNHHLFNFGSINGGRVTVGGWLDATSQYGIEASGFVLPKVKQSYFASSLNTNNPVINVPFNSGSENVLVNKNIPNTVFVSDTFQSYGFEINGLHHFQYNKHLSFIPFLGIRYLTIQENFLLNDMSFPVTGVVNLKDNFSTKNHFYGMQIGFKTQSYYEKWCMDMSATLALGNNHQVLHISGNTNLNNQVKQHFGIFSEPTNLGTHTNNLFSVIPELRIKLGYQLTQHIVPFITYDGFYVNHIIRPGKVIDRNINKSQNPLIGGSGVLSGSPAPLPQFKNANMWMQGLSIGINFYW